MHFVVKCSTFTDILEHKDANDLLYIQPIKLQADTVTVTSSCTKQTKSTRTSCMNHLTDNFIYKKPSYCWDSQPPVGIFRT